MSWLKIHQKELPQPQNLTTIDTLTSLLRNQKILHMRVAFSAWSSSCQRSIHLLHCLGPHWTPALRMSTALLSIQALLDDPNPEDVLNTAYAVRKEPRRKPGNELDFTHIRNRINCILSMQANYFDSSVLYGTACWRFPQHSLHL